MSDTLDGRIHFGSKVYKVGTYEPLVILASNIQIQRIHMDPESVASEYLTRCKAGAQKKGNDSDH